MIKIKKNLTCIFNELDKKYRISVLNRRGIKSILITELEKQKEPELEVDNNLIWGNTNIEDTDLDNLDDIFDNIDTDELFSDSDSNELLSEEDDFSEEDDLEDESNNEDDLIVGNSDDFESILYDDEEYTQYTDGDSNQNDINESLTNQKQENKNKTQHQDKNNFIKELSGTKNQDIALKILNGEYKDVDYFEDLSSLDNNQNILETKAPSTELYDEEVKDSTNNGLLNTLMNDKKTTLVQYTSKEPQDLRYNGEKIVYHWLYKREKVVDLENNQDTFYDLIVREYEYGSYPTALVLSKKVSDILSKKGLKLEEELDNRANMDLVNINLNGITKLAQVDNYISEIESSEDEESTSLTVYKDLSGKELKYEYYSPEADLEIYLFNSDKFIPHKLIDNVPYSEKESFEFSNEFKRKLKESGNGNLRFPNVRLFKQFLNLDYIESADYRIIDDEEGLKWFKSEIDKLHPDHVIAYDAETTGLNFRRWLKPEDRDELVTHSFSWKDNQAVIIPVKMKNRKNITREQELKYVKPVMEKRCILAHNGAADILFNKYSDIEINLVEDTYHLIKHLIPYIRPEKSKTRSKVKRSLAYLLNRTFGRDKINLKKYVFDPQGAEFDFSVLPDEYLIYYGCPDTDQLRQLWKSLRPKLREKQELSYRATVRFSKLMAEKATFEGIKLSEEVIIENKEKTEQLLDFLKALALKVAGETEETLNIGSSSQIASYIYGKMGVPVTSRTKRTKEGLSADKYVIDELSSIKRATPSDMFTKDIMDIDDTVLIKADDLNNAQYPFLLILKHYNDNRKNLTAYYNGLIKNSIDGIYYPDPAIGSTATWRTTERTQITKSMIKKGLEVYDKDEYYMISMDFSAEELRLAVNQSDDDGFKDILEDPERDPHRAAAAQIFQMDEYKVTPSIRKKAKTANFGIIYGMAAKTLAQQMAGTKFINAEQLQEGRKVYAGYKYRYGRMLKPLEQAGRWVQENGYLYNNLGYLMIYEEVLDIDKFEAQIFDPDRKEPAEIILDPQRYSEYAGSLKNKAGNYPIQSWAAGLLMIFSLRFEEELKKHGIYDKVSLPLTVHDEVDMIIHKSVHPLLMMKIIKSVFESKLEGLGYRTIPLFVGIGYGMSWGDAKSDDAEIPVELQNIMVSEYDSGNYKTFDNPREIPGYFWERKKDYFRRRLQEILKEEIETKNYVYAQVRGKLRHEIYVLNQCADVFNIYNGKKGEYYHDKIIEVMLEGTGIKPEDMHVDTFDEIDEEEDDNKAVDFFFNPIIHERLFIAGKYLVIDINGLTKTILKTLLYYIQSYRVQTPNVHSKEAVVKIGNETKPLNFYIDGLPFNSKDVITKILSGDIGLNDIAKVTKKTNTTKLTSTDINKLVKKDIDKRLFIINLTEISRIKGFNDIKITIEYVLKTLQEKEFLGVGPEYNYTLILGIEKEGKYMYQKTNLALKNNVIEKFSVLI